MTNNDQELDPGNHPAPGAESGGGVSDEPERQRQAHAKNRPE